MSYEEDYDDIMAKTKLKCLLCGCRLINWTWDSMHCTLCIDKLEKRRRLKKRFGKVIK